MAMTEKEFVQMFDPMETELIETACNEFIKWKNVHDKSADTFHMIGLGASILDLFQNPDTYNKNRVHPMEYAGHIVELVYVYMTIMIDAFNSELANDPTGLSEGTNDCMIYCNNRTTQCKELLTKLVDVQ